MPYPVLHLHKGKERSLLNFHPWVFSGAIAKQESGLTEGCVADIHTFDNRFLARAHFHKGSIVARVLTWKKQEIDAAFFKERLAGALAYRQAIGIGHRPESNAFRLVHGEADGLPGLVIDVYDNVAVIQAHTAGMHLALPQIVESLQGTVNVVAIYNKSASTLKVDGFKTENGYLLGRPTSAVIIENGLRFNVNWEEGQKTGFYLDQRENRLLAAAYAKGRNVLNTFAYTGGFSLPALRAGARVDSVDSSSRSGQWMAENIALNFKNADHRFFEADAMEFLRSGGESYNMIILDPPAFAKRLSAVSNAVTGYRTLNHDAIKRIAGNGILFTFSCSQVIDRMVFRKTVFQAAAQAKRKVRIMHQLSQAPDHPVSLFHPEGEYLKGLVLFVE